jgi:hypothetical protein
LTVIKQADASNIVVPWGSAFEFDNSINDAAHQALRANFRIVTYGTLDIRIAKEFGVTIRRFRKSVAEQD